LSFSFLGFLLFKARFFFFKNRGFFLPARPRGPVFLIFFWGRSPALFPKNPVAIFLGGFLFFWPFWFMKSN